MFRFRRFVTPLVVGAIAILLAIVPSLSAQSSFTEPFDGSPTTPQAYSNPKDWDIFVQGFDTREPNVAQHGPNCESPDFPYSSANTHLARTAADAVFLCGTGANTHLMTTAGLTGYGAIYMTPPSVMSFANGPAVLKWNMSTLRTAARDWVDIVLTPLSEHSDMAYNNNDQHVPPDNIHIQLAGTNVFLATQRTGGSLTYNGMTGDVPIAGDTSTTWDQVFQRAGLEESAARRDTFQVTLTTTTISVCMPTYGFCWMSNAKLPKPLDPNVWHGQASVMFGHRSYNPEKSCSDVEDQFAIVHNPTGDRECPPNTWHWDDVSIAPGVPFQIIQPVTRAVTVNSPNPTTVQFQAPAPAGASLSFVQFGHTPDLRVSYDAGRTWHAPRIQPANAPNNGASEENGEQIFDPIPAGTQSIMTKGSNGFWGTFEAEGFVIIGPAGAGASGGPTVTPTVTATSTASATPTRQPTAVPTASPQPATPTSTAIATSTASPVPSQTAVPTDTPTPVPSATATPTLVPTNTPTPAVETTCAVLVVVGGETRAVARPPEFCTDQE